MISLRYAPPPAERASRVAGAAVEQRDAADWTPLMHAAAGGHDAAAAALLVSDATLSNLRTL